MKLRDKFIAFAVIIHVILIALSLLLLSVNNYLFFASELIIVVSLIVTIRLYRAILRPVNLMTAGIESIKDRDFSTKFVPTGHYEMDQLVDVYNSMIDRLRDERVKVREHHYLLERLINATPIGVIILGFEENITMLNPAALSIFGGKPDDYIGRPIGSLTGLPGVELGSLEAGETRFINVNGIRSYKCRKSHFVDRGFSRDFVLVEQLTGEILDTQKKAYGKVIRMMSHEINNTVGAINSILSSSLHYRNDLRPEDRKDFSDAMEVAIERNQRLNRFMSNFADVVRIPPPSVELHDLRELLKSVGVLMAPECEKRGVRWVWEIPDAPMPVACDLLQMEQVLVNVLKNALEAVDQNGSITVSSNGEMPPRLRIIDTGKGVKPEQKSQLFTPFFSTKRDGQGIGLTMVREILVNHGFAFNLESREPGHTEFWIEFKKQEPG